MPAALFDMDLRVLRRDRAARLGPELFLYERLLGDCLERLAMMQRRFGRALVIGCPAPAVTAQLAEVADVVDLTDPGPLFAACTSAGPVVEDQWTPEARRYDLILALGTLDTVNDLPRALLTIRFALAPGGMLLGALPGGDNLPKLRAAMRAADLVAGAAAAHVHPRVEPAALVGLIAAAGFERPVVDVDRMAVSYPTLQRVVSDLRRMAATNILVARPRRPLLRAERDAAIAAFAAAGTAGRTVETFEFLHFAGWAGPPG